MKNDSDMQFFSLYLIVHPLFRGEMGVVRLLSNWQDNFWTCCFFIGAIYFTEVTQDFKYKNKCELLESQTPL